VDEFRPAIDAILALLDKLDKGQPGFLPANYRSPSLIGFSQGAALSSMLALLHPDRIDRLAALAGFLPEDAASLVTSKPLEGKKVFIAHGTRDDRVPVERARQAVEQLKQAGAQVTYCEEDVGHKLSAGCFRGLGSFFK
jgi:phospholipase/carboxylesterase